jgi:putative copper export protein
VERDAFRSLRLRLTAASGALIAFVGLRFGILTAQMGDGTSLLDPELAPLAWTALGASTVMVLIGAAAAALSLWFGSRIVAALGAVVLSAGFGLTGHSQGLADPGLAPATVAAHVLIAGFWVAAPFSLFPTKGLDDAKLLARLNRFSTIAIAAVPILIALGAWLAWILTGSPAKLFSTTYGLLLLAKLAIGVLAMGLGALNKQVITAKVGSAPATGRAWLRVTLLLEATLFAAAIIAVSAATTIGGPSE